MTSLSQMCTLCKSLLCISPASPCRWRSQMLQGHGLCSRRSAISAAAFDSRAMALFYRMSSNTTIYGVFSRQTLYWSYEIVQDKGCPEQVELNRIEFTFALCLFLYSPCAHAYFCERHGFSHMRQPDSQQEQLGRTQDQLCAG